MAAADIAVEGDRGRLTDAGLDPSVERQASKAISSWSCAGPRSPRSHSDTLLRSCA
jgi:hypothetical protein